MTCDRCGSDGDDGQLIDCPECGQTFCAACYGEAWYLRCRACRQADDAERRARAVDGGQS
jgi:hypothetical protein